MGTHEERKLFMGLNWKIRSPDCFGNLEIENVVIKGF